ncbi:MAG: hypothetical protein ACYC0V_11270, partial [Armatimonadota bacterium]
AEEQGKEASQRMNVQLRQMLKDLGVANGDKVSILERRIEALEQRLNQSADNPTTPDVEKL